MDALTNFFYPSSFKIKLALALMGYCLVSLVFISSFNTTRSKGPVELNVIERTGTIIGYPAVFLVLPFFYTSENVFTAQTTLYELMKGNGCKNCDDEKFKEPIRTSTSLGFATGVLIEVLFFYCLACLISSLRDKSRKRT